MFVVEDLFLRVAKTWQTWWIRGVGVSCLESLISGQVVCSVFRERYFSGIVSLGNHTGVLMPRLSIFVAGAILFEASASNR